MIIFAVLLTALSCTDTGNLSDGGVNNPLSECVLPAVVQAGDEALVQWDGFTMDSRVFLISDNGTEYEMSVRVFTSSGIMFVVPVSVPTGFYAVVVEDDIRKELGTIEVVATDMPVTAVNIPSGGISGEEIIIEGIGYERGCSVIFVDADGNEYVLDATLISTGISIRIPEDLPLGDYMVYLLQDGGRWLITSSFSVYDGGAKSLRRIDFDSPYLGSSVLRLSWEMDDSGSGMLTLSESLVEGSEVTLQTYDRYECDATGYFELAVDGFESSNDLGISYIRDADGVVKSSDVLIYGNSSPTTFTWTYDADGYLIDISSPSRSFRSLSYTDGDLIMFRNVGFAYEDPELVNHPSAPDVAWAYMALMEPNDPFVYIPYLMGWYRKTSSRLPSALNLPSPTGTGVVSHLLSYEYDDDGYVVRMMWGSSSIDFIYE